MLESKHAQFERNDGTKPIHCPECNAHMAVIKHGLTSDGKQPYRCQNPNCRRSTFVQEYANPRLFARKGAGSATWQWIKVAFELRHGYLKLVRQSVIEGLKKGQCSRPDGLTSNLKGLPSNNLRWYTSKKMVRKDWQENIQWVELEQ